jgi:hypothetical protein
MDSRTKAIIKRASKDTRRRITRLDKETSQQLQALYRQARDDIQRIINGAESLDGTLKIEQLGVLKQQLERRLYELDNTRDQYLVDQMRVAVNEGISPFASAGGAFNQLAETSLRQSINFIAADGLQLSDRIWKINQHERAVIANQVEQAIIQGDSAARAAREFVSQNLAVPADIQRKMGQAQALKIANATGAELMASGSPYSNALRLFRTEINRAHGEAYQTAAFESPDVVGTKFLLSPGHPKPDICDMHARVNRYGLGPGVYPKGKNPWPAHPNTLSFTVVVFADEVTAEDKAGKEDRITWLKKQPAGTQYAVLNSSKKVAALDRDILKEGHINTPWKTLKKSYVKKGHDPDSWTTSTAKPTPAPDLPPQTIIADFVPAKTPKEAARWAMDNNLADYVDYTGASAAAANEWNESVMFHVRNFPELREGLRFIGTMQGRNTHWYNLTVESYFQQLRSLYGPEHSDAYVMKIVKRRIKKPRVSGNTYAVSARDNEVSGVSVNSKWAKDPAAFAESLGKDVESGFHPIGNDSIKSVIDHELGHQLDHLLGLRNSQRVNNLYKEWRYNDPAGAELSRYAQKNIAEFIAEAWAEYLNNPNPRAISREIGAIVNDAYRSLHND